MSPKVTEVSENLLQVCKLRACMSPLPPPPTALCKVCKSRRYQQVIEWGGGGGVPSEGRKLDWKPPEAYPPVPPELYPAWAPRGVASTWRRLKRLPAWPFVSSLWIAWSRVSVCHSITPAYMHLGAFIQHNGFKETFRKLITLQTDTKEVG